MRVLREEYLAGLADELASHEASFHSHASDREQADCVAGIARAAVVRLRRAP